MDYLIKNNIQALIHYPIPLHLQNAYKFLGYKKGDLPIVEKVSKEIISLPMFAELKEIQIKSIINIMNNFYEKN